MRKKALISLILVLVLAAPASAQYYSTGSAPAGTRWNIIKGEHFDIIYPRETDSLAREYLYQFERYRDADLTGLHVETPKVPILLQPYDMYSNGSVVWAPRRVELYTTPLATPLYALDWPTQLAVHEGRHIGQMAHYTKGFYKVLSILTGEQGIAVGVGLYPTKMLLEGDAVQNETDLTGSGRGRDPEFLKYYRAAFLMGDFRNYFDWRYGSYRRYTPNKYAMGYMLTSTMRNNSGNYFATGDIMEVQVNDWWRVFSVSHRAYQRATGLTSRKNWRAAVARNTELWAWEYKLRAPYTPTTPLLRLRYPVYTEISNPVNFGDRTFATMTGMQFERRLISIDTLGNRKFRHLLSSSTSQMIADSDHSLIFSEIVPDPRWEHRSWSILRRYNTETNHVETITRRTRYVNPTPSAGRDSIFAAEYLTTGGSNVVVLDRSGKLLDRIHAPESGQVTGIAQLGDDLYCSIVTGEGMGLFRYDGKWSRVIDPQTRMIRSLQAEGDSLLLFVSDLDGISNIYEWDPSDGQLWRITSTRFSAAEPSVTSDGRLFFGEYDHYGYQPAEVSLSELDRKKASFDMPYVNDVADKNAEQAESHVPAISEEEKAALRRHIDSLQSRPYSKIAHGIHIHSWFPLYVGVDRLMNDIGSFDFKDFSNWHQYVAPGATLVSQNNLGTLSGTLGYAYHHRRHTGHFQASYSGLYPVFDVSVDFNDRNTTHTLTGNQSQGPSGGMTITDGGKPALVINTQVSFPLNLSRGGWVTRFIPSFGYAFTNDTYEFFKKEVPHTRVFGKNTQMLTGSIRFSTQMARPTSRLTPRFGVGFVLSAMMRMGPAYNPVGGLTAWTYLPGFGREDGFKLTYATQNQPRDGVLYTPSYNLVRRPNGYANEILMDYQRVLLEYALPIYAGDIDGGFLFYLKRFIAIPFVDYAFDRFHPVMEDNHISQVAPKHFFSYGTSLLVNTRLFRIGTDFQLGVRYSRAARPDHPNEFRFIFSTGL